MSEMDAPYFDTAFKVCVSGYEWTISEEAKEYLIKMRGEKRSRRIHKETEGITSTAIQVRSNVGF